MFIKTEFCESNLKQWLQNRKIIEKYTFKDEKIIFHQTIQALSYLHKKGNIHRDIKPSNILLKNEKSEIIVKLGDFGLVRRISDNDKNKDLTAQVGTPIYCAPETINQIYDTSVDIYSLGIVGLQLFSEENIFAIKGKIMRKEDVDSWLLLKDDYLASMLTKMIQMQHDDRPTAEGLLFHKFFKGGKDDFLLQRDLNYYREKNSQLSQKVDSQKKEIMELRSKLESYKSRCTCSNID